MVFPEFPTAIRRLFKMRDNRLRFFASLLLLVLFFVATKGYSATPIANVTQFKGEAVIQSGETIFPIKQIGQPVNKNDRIQTRKGEVEITFTDGALTRIRPFTNGLIQERVEKSGTWIFKTERKVRRITTFVGKLYFKSGSSNIKNCLQTPTTVVALRGSSGDLGYNNKDTFFDQKTGGSDITGPVVKGAFSDPGAVAANRNPVYRGTSKAAVASRRAKEKKDPVAMAEAKKEAVKVKKEAAAELKKNADPVVKKGAEAEEFAAEAAMAAVEAEIHVEKVKVKAEKAKKEAEEAKAKGDEKEAEKADRKAKNADEALEAVEKVAEAATRAKKEARDAAEALDVEKARKAAGKAKEIVEVLEKTAEISTSTAETTTVETTTAETTTAETTTSTAETTTAETTSSSSTSSVETTSSTSTTTSTTTTTTTTTTSEETTVSPSS